MTAAKRLLIVIAILLTTSILVKVVFKRQVLTTSVSTSTSVPVRPSAAVTPIPTANQPTQVSTARLWALQTWTPAPRIIVITWTPVPTKAVLTWTPEPDVRIETWTPAPTPFVPTWTPLP